VTFEPFECPSREYFHLTKITRASSETKMEGDYRKAGLLKLMNSESRQAVDKFVRII